jgi:hypothetical protein
MPTHWTYEAFDADSDLFQGDILEPTERLRLVLKEVHPHFLDPKYTAFQLLTQSCDLSIRKSRCNTRYLSIAVIRPIAAVLHDFLSHVCKPVIEGVYVQETKGEAYRLLERLFNQNEQTLGLFYLHPDPDLQPSILAPSVSLLKITVTLRVEHYDILKEARRARLRSEFRSKLGWLVGNLYSRIGTQDWSESPERNKDMTKLVKQYLDPADSPDGPMWVPKTCVEAAKSKGIQLELIEKDKIQSILEANKPPAAKDNIIAQALRVLKEAAPSFDDESLQRVKNRLNNDSQFAKAIRSAKSE